MKTTVKLRHLGIQPYEPIWQQLKEFTHSRLADTTDEIWLLEHEAVFTQGQAGKAEHVINQGSIPVVKSDRGGQVTYHGPGQLIVYFLTDIQRKKLNIREFSSILEQSVIELLSSFKITAKINTKAPGVYVDQAKICSLGLRVRHGRTYHGLSLNVNMDLEPFSRINPCGYADLKMVQISELGGPDELKLVATQLLNILVSNLGYSEIIYD